MGDKGGTRGRQVGDKCKLTRPKAPRVRDKCGRQGGDRWETHAAQGTQSGRQGGGKCKLMRPKAPRVGDKGEISVNSWGPRNPEWGTSVVAETLRRDLL